MKKLTELVPVLVFMLMASCQKDDLSGYESGVTRLSAELVRLQPKTWLDSQADGTLLPVYWSDGDVINVNGCPSQPLRVADGEKVSKADFEILDAAPPFKVIYPAQFCADSTYSTDTTLLIDIPENQEYSPSTFGNGSAILYGYSGDGDNVIMHNLCGALRVNLVDDPGEPIEDAVVRAEMISNSEEAPIAGSFRLNPATGKYTVVSGKTVVSLDIKEAVALDKEEPRSFYFTVPAGTYPKGFTIKLYNKEGHLLQCKWLREAADAKEGVVVHAGELVDFKKKEFVRGAMEIMTESQWLDFVTLYNAKDEKWKDRYLLNDGRVALGADLTIEQDVPMIASLSDIVDGCGYTMTVPHAGQPLVRSLVKGGVVRNLTLAGRMETSSAPRTTGVVPFVSVLDGGTIERCVNNMDIDFTTSATMGVAFAGFACNVKGGVIKECVNNAFIRIVPFCEDGSCVVHGGGIMALADDLSDDLLIDGCRNAGVISVLAKNGTYDKNGTPVYTGMTKAAFGGIAGLISGAGVVTVRNCSNEAEISVGLGYYDAAAAGQCSLGGILGAAAKFTGTTALAAPGVDGHVEISVENCTNSGNLCNDVISSSKDILAKCYTGGIAGSLFGKSSKKAQITDCTSTGRITTHSKTYRNSGRCCIGGGLIGLGGYAEISGCSVVAEIGNSEKMSYALAGVIGTALADFSISGSKAFVNISMIRLNTTTSSLTQYNNSGNYALAVTCQSDYLGDSCMLSSSTISDSQFGGNFSLWESTALSATPTKRNENIYSVSADGEYKYNDHIISSTYTGGKIALSGNRYWNGE